MHSVKFENLNQHGFLFLTSQYCLPIDLLFYIGIHHVRFFLTRYFLKFIWPMADSYFISPAHPNGTERLSDVAYKCLAAYFEPVCTIAESGAARSTQHCVTRLSRPSAGRHDDKGCIAVYSRRRHWTTTLSTLRIRHRPLQRLHHRAGPWPRSRSTVPWMDCSTQPVYPPDSMASAPLPTPSSRALIR
jgi:hypothetical protein